MNIIDRFTEQHYQIIALCKEMKIRAMIENLENDVISVYELQEDLNETLGAHLRLEDLSLYPMLLEHENSKIRDNALKLQGEVSSCTLAHTQYQKKYASQQSIKDNIYEYSEDTQKLATAILERIQKEEIQLYSLLR